MLAFLLVVLPVLFSGVVEPLLTPPLSPLLGWLADLAILSVLGILGGPVLTRRVMAPAFVAASADPVEFGPRSMTVWLHPLSKGSRAPREAVEVPFERIQQVRHGGFLPPLVSWKVEPAPPKGSRTMPTSSTVLTRENMQRFQESYEQWKTSPKSSLPLA